MAWNTQPTDLPTSTDYEREFHPGAFYESPFTDIDEKGIARLSRPEQTAEIIRIVEEVNLSASA